MSKAKAKPQSVLAKADAKIQQEHRDIYPDYDADVVRYGRSVADFNAGFLDGDENGREDMAKLVLPVFRDVSAKRAGKWTPRQRKTWDFVYSRLMKYAGKRK